MHSELFWLKLLWHTNPKTIEWWQLFQSFLGLFTSSSKALFTSKSSLERNKKVRKFVPEIIKDKSIHEIRSVLEFPIEAEDHQSVYKCRAFAAATMSAPKESALKATFNVTCKFFCFNFTHDCVCVNKNSKKKLFCLNRPIGSSICFSNYKNKYLSPFKFLLHLQRYIF